MTDALTLYTNPMSRGRIARWMLEEVGAPYRTEVVAYGPAMKGPEFLALNPMGKVPVLRHGAAVVTECAAICAYLAEAFPEAGLAPREAERAPYLRWMFFAAGPLEAAVVNRSLGVEVPPERRGMVGYGSFEAAMDALEAAVTAAPFVAGSRFTAADVYVGSHVAWGLRFGSIEDRPAFRDYRSRIEGRPAQARAEALDDAAMPRPRTRGPKARGPEAHPSPRSRGAGRPVGSGRLARLQDVLADLGGALAQLGLVGLGHEGVEPAAVIDRAQPSRADAQLERPPQRL